MITEIRRAEQLGLDFVVLHPGAHMGKGEKEGLKRIADALDQAIEQTADARCAVVIENTAGQGSCVGCTFQHLEYLLTHVRQHSRLGFCIDTCHLFASGYDIRTMELYNASIGQLLDCIPPEKICAFHLNDSKKDRSNQLQ